MDAFPDALGLEVADRRVGRGEEEIGKMVGDDPVDLLGHEAVERAEPRLDVVDRDVQLGGRECAGEGGVGVAVDEDAIGLLVEDDPFDRLEHPSGLGTVRARTDLEVMPGSRHPEFLEEHVRHPGVVVLAGVDEALGDPLGRQCLRHDRRLHELGAGADDGENASLGRHPREGIGPSGEETNHHCRPRCQESGSRASRGH